jgi:hypothetical protein
MTKRDIHIGTATLQDVGHHFVDAWKKAEQGHLKKITHESIYFTSIATLVSALSEKRVELLKALQKHPGLNTHELAKQLHRHYKNVHTEVAMLKKIGLIEELEGNTLVVPYTKIHAEIDIAA